MGVLGMHVGHDHQNDWASQYEHLNPVDKIKRSMIVAYGVKTGRELYYINKRNTDIYKQWPTIEPRRLAKNPYEALNGTKYTNGLFNLDFNDTKDHDGLHNTGNGKYKKELIGSTKYFPKPGSKNKDNPYGFDHSGATLMTYHPYENNTVYSHIEEVMENGKKVKKLVSNDDFYVRGKFDMEHMYIDTLDVQDTIKFSRDLNDSEIKRNDCLFGKWLAQRATDLPNIKYNSIYYPPEIIK